MRIVTGFVEPHFFAGWSGGPKGVCPGLADTATILEAHSPARLADAAVDLDGTRGNPVHEFVTAATALCPPDLSVDVTIDSRRRLTGVFAGPLPDGHRAACAFAADTVTQSVDGRFDVVLTTNGGYPLDRNLYQAVKGMAAAERVVAPGGIIVVAAACGTACPTTGRSPASWPGPRPRTSWSVPVGPARSTPGRPRCSAGSSAGPRSGSTRRGSPTTPPGRPCCSPVHDLDAAVSDALARKGPGARLCVLPHGPLTVATAS